MGRGCTAELPGCFPTISRSDSPRPTTAGGCVWNSQGVVLAHVPVMPTYRIEVSVPALTIRIDPIRAPEADRTTRLMS